MADVLFNMPAQFHRRAATASFIVELYEFFYENGPETDTTRGKLFGEQPAPPDHLDLEAVQDCQAIASTLVRAVLNRYQVDWTVEEYQKDIGRNVLLDPGREDLLMRKYSPLIDVHEVLKRLDQQLPVVSEPAVITDSVGNILVWSLPGVIPERRQGDMLTATRFLEAQLTATYAAADEPLSKTWRTAGNIYFSKGIEWTSGTTLLYPAGFAQGHTGPKFRPTPSSNAKAERVTSWMHAFETAGGLLDGILAVAHPALYEESQVVAEQVFRNFGACRSLLSHWPTCFSSTQVIVNRSSPLHRDISGRIGWLELLLTLGTYGDEAVLQLRNLGVSLPYTTGSVALLCGRQILHGVPTVGGDRICYAFYMNKHLFKKVDAVLPGPAVLPVDNDEGSEGEQPLETEASAGEGESAGGAKGSDEDADGSDDVGVRIHCGHGGSRCPRVEAQSGPETSNRGASDDPTAYVHLPSLDPTDAGPTPVHLSDLPTFPDSLDAETDDEEIPYMVEQPESDFEDEDGDLYYGTKPDRLLPEVSELPWFGESPRQPAPTPRSFGSLRSDRMVVVVDIDGIHELPFTFCLCPNAPTEDIQLLDLGYYPATSTRPKTVFTKRVLDDFLLSNRECKTSPRNYYNKLRRVTNPSLPHMVPDRYKELLRVSRQWQFSRCVRRLALGTEMAISGPETWQWKYTRSVVMDGNFSAQHRQMRNPSDDVPLADGHAFMVEEKPYKEHLRTAKEYQEKSTCHDHRAVFSATIERAKLEATGIGAAACSRHGFFCPHACVDFQQGERQRNMDYVLNWILAFLNGLRNVIVLYDIMCQYFVHLYDRFDKSPHLHMPAGLTILRGIGQFHVHGHVPKCFPRFSCNFIPGAGVQDGEIIETLWNKTNAIADSTRGMSAAHRREVIDDHMNDSNWMKLTRMTVILIRKWKRACNEWKPAVTAWEELSAASDGETVAKWTREAEAADKAREKDPAAMDIYDVDATPVPTRKEIQVMLGEQELADGERSLGAADWISTGLRIEETKLGIAYAARHTASGSGTQTRLSLVQQRQKLASAIIAFHKTGREHMPGLIAAEGGDMDPNHTDLGVQWDEVPEAVASQREEGAADTPETHPHGLPSTFGIRKLRQADLLDLARKERKLREGQMNDALQGIRTGIGYKSLLYRAKVRNASSYRSKLRSFDDVHVADEGVRKHVRIYMQSRAAMERLFDPEDEGDRVALAGFRSRYREIQKEDLKASTTVLEAFTPGLRNQHSAWFWNVSDTETGDGSSWTQEYRRMLWLRAYARKQRWDEEVVLVPFEMDCVLRCFGTKATDWEGWSTGAHTPGHAAFALRQVAMWRNLKDHARSAFASARSTHRP
uniref:Cytochrome P450 monooxygenase AKT7 ) n=1 Tax=Ganoderma boninense TaxID=34458 RepID=A0A5K1K7S0_9APHY|nr:Cytochrome P450 monooxygenase AKT7 (EC (AK-toxin biosynthesis protein 7) [Ganoderma boninense]